MQPTNIEIWKPACGFEHLYEVSNHGRVRRAVYSSPHPPAKPGKILKCNNQSGYQRLSICNGGKITRILLHRIIAATFIGGDVWCDLFINHKNGIPSDNRPENLEWVTAKQNVRHAWKIGLCSPIRGESHGAHKLTNKDVLEIRSRAALGEAPVSLAKEFRVTDASIYYIIKRKTWRHI